VRRSARILALVGVNVVAAALALEAGVRLMVPMSDEFLRPDAAAGVHHIEGRRGRWISREFDVTVAINSHGFRDRERATAKPPGTRRIAVLGDSITEALQVPLEETFTARLERQLTTTERPVEVLNLGVSALGPAQEYLVFRAYGVRYTPDVVVLTVFTANDFRGSVSTLEGKSYLRYPEIASNGRLARSPDGDIVFSDPVVPSRARQWLSGHVASYRFVRERVRARLGRAAGPAASGDVLAIYREAADPVWRRAIDVTLEMIGELDAAVRRAGARLVVLVVPAPWDVDPRAREQQPEFRGAAVDWHRPQRLVTEWLAARGIVGVTVADAFAHDVAAGGRPFFPVDGHLTPDGHRIVADRLAAVLRDL
jgi:lysophospholipase L1-like esterase